MNDLSEYIYKLMKTRHPLPLVMSISVTDECNLDDKVILESLIKRKRPAGCLIYKLKTFDSMSG